ncbi:MAG: DUF6941 family protein [Lachnospiraceae bacterium]
MAYLANFLYCLSAERQQAPQGRGDSVNAMGVLTVLTPEFVPGLFSFSIIFSILDIDANSENQIKIVFKDSTGKELVNTENITMPPVPTDGAIQLPPKYTGYNLSMDFRNVVFENEGECTTDIYFNNTLLGSHPIYVKGRR